MIAYIKGKLLSAENGTVILENNGVGYEIVCSASLFSKLVNNDGGEAWTYLAVRDDGMSLFGFDNLSEKAMFLKLISVSGVGPKMGITILSGMNLNDLAYCIASSDVKTLSSIKGLGKKTAERIILELREAIGLAEITQTNKPKNIVPSKDADIAVTALINLGFSKNDSQKSVDNALENGIRGLEEIITFALKNM